MKLNDEEGLKYTEMITSINSNLHKINKIKNMIFRHYGADCFDPSLFKVIKNHTCFVKPYGGLWLSPINPEYYRWEDFCNDNNFEIERMKKHIDFKVKKDSRILVLDTIEAIRSQPTITLDMPFQPSFVLLDFEKISEDYDAIFYDEVTNEMRYTLYGWDVTSLLILNKDILEENK